MLVAVVMKKRDEKDDRKGDLKWVHNLL